MICKYHPHAELTSTLEDFQPNYAVGAGERIVRTRLRCSVIVDVATGRLCPFVDVQHDADHVDERFCSKCGKKMHGGVARWQQCYQCAGGAATRRKYKEAQKAREKLLTSKKSQ